MVDVSHKAHTQREARAMAVIHMLPETLQLIAEGKHKKGGKSGHWVRQGNEV